MKPVIEQLSTNTEFGTEFAVSHDFWTKISEAVDVLQIPYLATKQMQRNGYGLADFYISWLRMKRGLSRINNGELNLARQLDKALEERENLLLETPTMMLAMYLHPRVKNRLNNIQKECATIAAEKLHIRLTNVGNQSGANVSANDTLDELNAEVSGGYSNADNNTNAAGSNITLGQFRESIIKYDAVRPTDIKSNVFGFWKERKQEFPMIYNLACVVHAVNAGQCEVERNFSAFSSVRDSRRCKLLPKNMSNILMIRLNQDVYNEWKSNQISKISHKRGSNSFE